MSDIAKNAWEQERDLTLVKGIWTAIDKVRAGAPAVKLRIAGPDGPYEVTIRMAHGASDV